MTKAEHAKRAAELREAMKGEYIFYMPTDWRLYHTWQYVNEARYVLPNGMKCNDEFYRKWKLVETCLRVNPERMPRFF